MQSSLSVPLEPPLRLSLAGHGKSNITAVVADASDHRLVLRRPPMGELLQSAHDVAREHRILSALGPTEVPTPGVLGFTDEPDVTEAPLMAMEYVDGLVLNDVPTAEALPANLRHAVAMAMVEALAAIHAVDLERTGLIDLASHKSYARRQLKRWTGQWEASRTRDLPQVSELARRLDQAVPEQRELTLVHGDFHMRNVLVDPGTGRVRAVLDWELCTLGDPLADLGGLLAYWHEPDDPPDPPFPVSALAGFPRREELAAAYGAITGRDLSALGFWEVLGLWKIAVILEGVRRRALNDPRNAERGANVPSAVIDSLVQRAWTAAEAAGI
jgi:aminoglycoside phosphotransferase (APT) family kinase protein